jgi:Domain of unknown function (DU1801)
VRPSQTPAVKTVFDSFPPEIREKLFALRALIFETAASIAGVGELEESLKWGEPAYSTPQSKSGSPIRIAFKAARPNEYAMYFICHTNLVDKFRTAFPHDLNFEGNRAIVFQVTDKVPVKELQWCIAAALTYHKDKRSLRKN